MSQQQWLNEIPDSIGWYITGFTDGEGSFNVSVKSVPDRAMGWRLEVSFNVSQRDRTMLALMKHHLGCGTLRERKDGVVYFEVTNICSLKERIIPFFKKFYFLSSTRKKNFSIFQKIVEKMALGIQNQQKGFVEIMQLREILNQGRGRKRKYEINNVKIKNERPRESSETTRQTF